MKYRTVEQILVGSVTKKGKKQISKKILNESLFFVSKNLGINPDIIIQRAVRRLSLIFEVRNIRRRRNSFNLPLPINGKRRNYLIVKKIIKAVNLDTTKRPLKDKIVEQIVNLVVKKNKPIGVVEREAIYKSAIKNKANVHFRWK